ncbi:MAG: TolC family protein [Planctomycetes bacterium]|nr:TolC family protein [Planctomycetota bacterium]
MTERRPSVRLAALSLCLMYGACVPTLGDAAARDADRDVPDKFDVPEATISAATLTAREFFTDVQLIALVDEALANNQELNILAQEVTAANSEILARQGEYQPRVGIGAGAGDDKVGKFTSQGASDEAHGLPEHLQGYGAGFNASWEIDVWGKLHDATKAAVYRFFSTVEGRRLATTRLVAELAASYYELMALDNRLEVLRANIEIQNQALEVVRVQKTAAQVTELAVQRFEAEVLRNRARVFDVQQQIVETENRINVLVGRFPQPVQRASSTFLELEPLALDAGVPTQLLENRPDLRQAELALEAAKLDVTVAQKSFYPQLSLEARAGVDAFDLHSLSIWPESLAYGAIANLAAPLWNRKALIAGFYAANAMQMQAVFGYERTLRTAYAEVANMVAMVRNFGGKYQLKAQQVAILRSAIDVSNKLFANARADYMEVLLTRRDALESQLELIETRTTQLRAMVDLYRALGGGWRDADRYVDPDGTGHSVGPVRDVVR